MWGCREGPDRGTQPGRDQAGACSWEKESAGDGIQFVAIAAGGTFACGLTADARLLCWATTAGEVVEITTPVPLLNISAGYANVCGLSAAGEVYCSGPMGGRPDLPGGFEPPPVTPVETSLRFWQISRGPVHTCGITLVDRRAYCWGNGPLGTGGPEVHPEPAPVADLGEVAWIESGRDHTCAITMEQEAYCWGSDLRGEIGDGPPAIPDPRPSDLIYHRPVKVALPAPASTISAGWGDATCALDTSFRAWCWGNNTTGVLGIGRHDFHAQGPPLRYEEVPVPVRLVK